MGTSEVLGLSREWGADTEWSRRPWEVRTQEPSISVVAAGGMQDDAVVGWRRSWSIEPKAGSTMGKGATQETRGLPEWLDADGAEWGGGGLVGKENASDWGSGEGGGCQS